MYAYQTYHILKFYEFYQIPVNCYTTQNRTKIDDVWAFNSDCTVKVLTYNSNSCNSYSIVHDYIQKKH